MNKSQRPKCQTKLSTNTPKSIQNPQKRQKLQKSPTKKSLTTIPKRQLITRPSTSKSLKISTHSSYNLHSSPFPNIHSRRQFSATSSQQHQSETQQEIRYGTQQDDQRQQHSQPNSSQTPLKQPLFRPFGGISELNSSTYQLRLPVPTNVTVSRDEIVKLSQLAYLSPPTTPKDVENTTNRITNMINWLSSITYIDVTQLPLTQAYKSKIVTTNEQFYKNDPSLIPFYTPLLLLPEFISPQIRGIDLVSSQSISISHLSTVSSIPQNISPIPQSIFTPECNLRARADIVEVCQANDVLTNARYTERSFYVAPKFSAGDE